MSAITIRKKRRKANVMQGWLLWFALTAAFSMMGVSMAAWQGGLDVGGEMGTAHIGVAFTDSHGNTITSTPPEDWGDPPASAVTYWESAKELKIEINNAYPGFEVDFYYEIGNTGSLPVKITRHDVTSSYSDVVVTNTLSDTSIDVSGRVDGDINVKVNNVEPKSVYTFTVDIEFEPDI